MFLEIITHSDPVIRGNGTVEQRGYDGYGRLSRQTLTQSNGQVLQQADYQRDANGNLTQRKSEGLAQFPALTASYRYDGLDRLTQERYDLTPERNADYSFDPNGNRLTRQQGVNGTEADEIYRYAAKSNRLVDKDALRQADALPEPVKDVTYDAKQRVRTLSVGGRLKAEYRYDARNLRTKKTLYDEAGAVSAEVYYHYDANGLLIGESDALGLVRREYVYLGMMPVAQIDIDAQGQESVVYFLTDQLATPRLGIDQSQAVVWKWESDAYGSIAPSGSVTVNLRFAGQYFDAESGWYYNWNRYYLPGEGRYLTSDPIGLSGGLNTYIYASGNPLSWIDPYGLDEIDDLEDWLLHHSNDDFKNQGGWEGDFWDAFAADNINAVNAINAGCYDDAIIAIALGTIKKPKFVAKTAARIVEKCDICVEFVKKVDYSSIKNPPDVGPGKDFTLRQKQEALKLNKAANGGVVKSDLSGTTLVKPQKSQRGVTPDPNEWQFDHIVPKNCGGTNCSTNIQILSRRENRLKSDK